MLTARQRAEEEDRFTASLAGLAIAVLLSIVSLFLIDRLGAVSKLEDCLLQGRKNCERIELSPGRGADGVLPQGAKRTNAAWSQFGDLLR
jgi:hypothetical protein